MADRGVASVDSSRAASSHGAASRAIVPGKQTQCGGDAPLQLAAAGAAAAGAPQRAGDWEMTSDLASAMGLGELSSAAPVQRAASGSAPVGAPSGDAAQATAQRGVAGASAPLPFADQIAGSFGRHDISDVRTATGGAAAEASQSLGAHAYATGNTIAFARSPRSPPRRARGRPRRAAARRRPAR